MGTMEQILVSPVRPLEIIFGKVMPISWLLSWKPWPSWSSACCCSMCIHGQCVITFASVPVVYNLGPESGPDDLHLVSTSRSLWCLPCDNFIADHHAIRFYFSAHSMPLSCSIFHISFRQNIFWSSFAESCWRQYRRPTGVPDPVFADNVDAAIERGPAQIPLESGEIKCNLSCPCLKKNSSNFPHPGNDCHYFWRTAGTDGCIGLCDHDRGQEYFIADRGSWSQHNQPRNRSAIRTHRSLRIVGYETASEISKNQSKTGKLKLVIIIPLILAGILNGIPDRNYNCWLMAWMEIQPELL